MGRVKEDRDSLVFAQSHHQTRALMMPICRTCEKGGAEGEVVEHFSLHWLMHSDRLSAIRGECCMLGRSADAGLTVNEIFKSRHNHRSDVCNVSETDPV